MYDGSVRIVFASSGDVQEFGRVVVGVYHRDPDSVVCR